MIRSEIDDRGARVKYRGFSCYTDAPIIIFFLFYFILGIITSCDFV